MSVCSSDSVDPQSDHQEHENSRCKKHQNLVEITRTPMGDQAMRHDEPLSLIKTWCTRRMNELPTVCGGMFRYDFGHDLVAPTPHRLGYQFLPFARGSHPRKPGPPPATLEFARKATSPATQCSAQVVLDRVAKALGWLEKAADSGYTQNRGWVASRGVSPVLAAHLWGAQARRTEAGEQRDSRLDLPHGCRS